MALSPTGRIPKLLWSERWQDTIQRMRTDNHVWWQLLKANAEKTGTAGQRYGDTGLWATIMFQATGDSAYATRALTLLRPLLLDTAVKSANWTRSNGAEQALLFDWLNPALTGADRQLYIAALNRWADQATTSQFSPNFPIRTDDSDQTVGNYFQFALLAVATADDNPRAQEFLNRSYVGGLTPTAADRTSLRNAISEYCTNLAVGGMWPESTQYNHGTLSLLTLGVEALRPATAVDSFPEVTALLPALAASQLFEVTPDLAQPFQWGDNENPRDLRLFQYVTLLGMLQGATQSSPGPVSAYLTSLIADLVSRFGATGFGSAEPWARLFLFYNPYRLSTDWRTAPRTFFAPGQGILIHRQADQPVTGALLGAHFRPRQSLVDHQVKYFGDFQLYRRGEWALTHPIGYQGPPNQGEGTNTMLHSGLSAMAERQVTAQESSRDGAYSYLAGTTSGPYYAPPYFSAPASFMDEWTRSLLYLPGTPGTPGTPVGATPTVVTPDVLIVHDRVNSTPIRAVDLPRYRGADQARIKAAKHPKEWIIHAPVAPTVTLQGLQWVTTKGQRVAVDTLLPLGQEREVIDEDTLWTDTYPNPAKSEQKWQVRVAPTVDVPLVNFLNVIQVADPAGSGTVFPARLVGDADGVLVGAFVARPNQQAVLAFFPANGPNLQATRLTIPLSLLDERQVDAYVAGIDVTQDWFAAVDGRLVTPLRIFGSNLLRFSLALKEGSHTLELGSAVRSLTFKLFAEGLTGGTSFFLDGEQRLSLTFPTLAEAKEVAQRAVRLNPLFTLVVEDLTTPGTRRLHKYTLVMNYAVEEVPL
jgi:hypothetical protein